MPGRKPKPQSDGVPLGGHDERPPNGYLSTDEDEIVDVDGDPDQFWDDGDPADRRKDPLRTP